MSTYSLWPASPRLRRERCGRQRRGAALVSTVLIAMVAAALAMTMLRAGLQQTNAQTQRRDLAAAPNAIAAALGTFEVQLHADPEFFLSRTFALEPPRVCATDPAEQPVPADSPWPAECGTRWSYAPIQDNGVWMQIQPPSTSNGALTVDVVAVAGEVKVGKRYTYRRAGSGRFSAASVADLSTADLAQGGVAPVVADGLYSAGTLNRGATALPMAQLAAEAGHTPAPAGQAWFYSATPNTQSDPVIGDVRDLMPAPLTVPSIAGGVDATHHVGCLPQPLASAAPTLCLQAGEQVLPLGQADPVTVPASTTAYLLLPGHNQGPGTVDVYATSAPGTFTTICPPGCDLRLNDTPAVLAGNHPGTLAFWEPGHLGTFALPVSGIIATDGDTHVGLCGASAAGAGFLGSSGCEVAGQLDEALSIVAGTSAQPRDLWVSGPIQVGAGGKLGLISSGALSFPYWSHPSAGQLDVVADLWAAGVQRGPGLVDPVQSVPAEVTPGPSPASDPNLGQALTITGSITAPRVDLALDVFGTVQLLSTPTTFSDPAPWFPGASRGWERASAYPLSPVQLAAMGL